MEQRIAEVDVISNARQQEEFTGLKSPNIFHCWLSKQVATRSSKAVKIGWRAPQAESGKINPMEEGSVSKFRRPRSQTILPLWLNRTQQGALLATALFFSSGYASIGLILVLAGVIAEGITTGRIPWRRSRVDFLLLAFVLVFLISGLLSPYRPTAVGSSVLAALTIYIAFGPLYHLLRREKNFLELFLRFWVIGAVFSSVWGILNHRLTPVRAFTAAIGPTALGTTLQVAVVLSVGLFLTSKPPRHLAATAIPVLVAGLALTYSRAAWIGGLSALGGFFLLVELRQSWRAFLLLILIGVVGSVFVALRYPSVSWRGGEFISFETPRDRVALAQAALAIFKDHPVVGTGLNTFSLVYPHYALPGGPALPMPFAHNIFLNMAAEGGVLGLAVFTVIIFWAMAKGWQWYATSSSTSETILSAAILCAFTGMMIQQLFDGTILSVHLGAGFWFFLAILAAFHP